MQMMDHEVKKKKEGDTWFVIKYKWWQQWMAFTTVPVGYAGKEKEEKEEGGEEQEGFEKERKGKEKGKGGKGKSRRKKTHLNFISARRTVDPRSPEKLTFMI
jgi:hypothetical protein